MSESSPPAEFRPTGYRGFVCGVCGGTALVFFPTVSVVVTADGSAEPDRSALTPENLVRLETAECYLCHCQGRETRVPRSVLIAAGAENPETEK